MQHFSSDFGAVKEPLRQMRGHSAFVFFAKTRQETKLIDLHTEASVGDSQDYSIEMGHFKKKKKNVLQLVSHFHLFEENFVQFGH